MRNPLEDRVPLELVPMTLRRAKAHILEHHRHLKPPQGGLWAVGVARVEPNGERVLAGVAVVGMPVARMLADGYTAEVTRVATDGTFNAVSMLYGACWRAARALGWRRLITYTLPEEGGASLRAAGWTILGETKAEGWNRPSRARADDHPTVRKTRWGKSL